MTVGIFGGSFDPPHEGHMHVASRLMKLLQLDEVWWIVSVNPLKSKCVCSLEERVAMVKNMIFGCRGMRVLCVGGIFSYEVVKSLKNRYPCVNFVWIAGSDILLTMHKWYRWREFCRLLPIALLERHGYVYGALRAPFAISMANEYLPDLKLLLRKRRGWSMVRGRVCAESSSRIRGA
ncbi:nicotinate-nucleotide adenylyltransferase [Anaplasma capra]|uniref:nicotinate-nucleotide adenylyltransferase n=1 Tax=Anaplasma capra TaxID=1562740 RepID=UPI0021D5CDE2|nr:nicotinate-nucleotide adenylyltransferase [Anaplasma capra]MCU7611439.1 nicotinate-nicotinamide nucleotide adenylyltransferase [Anaplasma capra]MCU7612122.1 nicotinate-nicotinamide nucleotide adenylyltransferase [Anaplasma capra]